VTSSVDARALLSASATAAIALNDTDVMESDPMVALRVADEAAKVAALEYAKRDAEPIVETVTAQWDAVATKVITDALIDTFVLAENKSVKARAASAAATLARLLLTSDILTEAHMSHLHRFMAGITITGTVSQSGTSDLSGSPASARGRITWHACALT
jgi:hypothetical protein